jgi:hypothetical protein
MRGKPPSEVLGIGCEWCAYCLDEALVFRRLAATRRREKEQQEQAEHDARIAYHREASIPKRDGVMM